MTKNPEPHLPEEEDDDHGFTFHPRNVILWLVIISLTVLFLTLTGSFIYTRIRTGASPLRLPVLFIWNTLLLLLSSYLLVRARRAYLVDEARKHVRLLWTTLSLTVLFLILQGVAWYGLFNQQIYIYSSNAAGYLYVISFLHFVHVIGGIPFLVSFILRADKAMQEPVSELVYFSDPNQKLTLRLLTIYWHFLDILWIYLVIFFWVNQWIQF